MCVGSNPAVCAAPISGTDAIIEDFSGFGWNRTPVGIYQSSHRTRPPLFHVHPPLTYDVAGEYERWRREEYGVGYVGFTEASEGMVSLGRPSGR